MGFFSKVFGGGAPSALVDAAKQGNVDAQQTLGNIYRFGENGVQKNDKEAAKWYAMAAERGNPAAQTQLGLMYCLGQGVQKDSHKGTGWLLLAAKQGFGPALLALQELGIAS